MIWSIQLCSIIIYFKCVLPSFQEVVLSPEHDEFYREVSCILDTNFTYTIISTVIVMYIYTCMLYVYMYALCVHVHVDIQ